MMNIAIVAGGDSGEYAISMQSGEQVEQQIDRNLYQSFLIKIRGSSWTYCKEGKEFPVDKNDFSLHLPGTHIRFDIVFNAIHGTPGENGKLQGYLEMLGIPYTSSNVITSALTFNKAFCKSVVARYGILTPHSVHLFRRQQEKISTLSDSISIPCFVKPNNGGSSVGMSKVISAEQLPAALELAFQEDEEVLVEEFIQGRELTCAVLRTKGEVVALPLCEIVSKKEFFDYEAKYTKGMADEIVPAPVSAEVSEECRRISTTLYNLLNCKGITRFDYIHTKDKFYFLEVNTVPGLTEASIVPKMIREHGWSYTELLTRLIEEAILTPKSPEEDLLPL
ncbi:MAG: D-alanine--D-alanine ligase [Bacteroidia bacterium]|nr:D-alanine--D-alanine ligase [Bacteroidia bacterium]